jgi:hypothetical protein
MIPRYDQPKPESGCVCLNLRHVEGKHIITMRIQLYFRLFYFLNE